MFAKFGGFLMEGQGSLVPRGRGAITQKHVTRSIPRDAEDSFSDDEIDILGEERRSRKLLQESRGQHRLIEPPIGAAERCLVQTSPSDISDKLIERTGDATEPLMNQAFIGEEVSNSYSSSQSNSTVEEDSNRQSAQLLATEDGDNSTELFDASDWSTDDAPSPEDVSEDYDPSQEPESLPSPERVRSTRKSKQASKKSTLEVLDDPSTTTAANQGTTKEGTNEDEFKTALQELVQKLGISNEAVVSIFKKLGISLSMDRIEIPSRTGSKDKREKRYYTAPTVTREILETHGSWEFGDEFRWTINVEPIPASDVYQPLSMDGALLDINEPPVRVRGPDQPHAALHIQILRALRGAKECMESVELKLQLPMDWGTEEHLRFTLDSNLELPKAYEDALKEDTAVPAAAEPQALEDDSALVSGDVDLRKMEKRPKQWGRQTTPESPLPGLIRNGIDDSPEMASPPPRYGSVDFGPVPLSVVQRLIRDNGLQPTADGARQLQSLLAVEKAELAHRQSLKTLCQRLYTAKERALYQGTDAAQGADLFGSNVPYPTIQYEERETIKTRDKMERSGNAAINEGAQDAKYGAAKRVLEWMDFVPLPKSSANRDKGNAEPDSERSTRENAGQKKKEPNNKDLTEVMVEEHCGILVKGMFWGYDRVKERENKILKFLQCFHLFGTDPKADYAVRLSGEEWEEWGALMAICLLSGECKMSSEVTKHTAAQLAMNSVPALIIFILVHLSTRTTADQAMPPWMWKYGFVYTEMGVTIYAHFPKLVVTEAGEAKWKFVSVKVSDTFADMWVDEKNKELRLRGLAALDIMRSHTESLLEQLLVWSKNLPASTIPIMDTLIAKAHLELEDYEWLKKKAQEKEEKREQGAAA